MHQVLQERPLGELAGFMADEQQRLVTAAEAAKPLPTITLVAADWAKLKTFLLDGGGDDNMLRVARLLRTAILADDQVGFWLAMFMLFKAVRLTYRAEPGM